MNGQELILSVIGDGELLTRSEISIRVGRAKNGAFVQTLERAVTSGKLNKLWCSIGVNSGWGYCKPEVAPSLFDGQGDW